MATTGSSLDADLAGMRPDRTPTIKETIIPVKKFAADSVTAKLAP